MHRMTDSPVSSQAARWVAGMAVTPHPAATRAGVATLKAGGNAVDAAVAANAVLAVVYCHSCGIGGDAFALVWEPGEQRLHGFNGSGRAPAGLTIRRVRDEGHQQMPLRGPLTITVPGAVDAWARLLERFGRRSLADCLDHAIGLAADGYKLTALSASAIGRSLETFDGAARAVFAPGGRLPAEGDLFRQPMLAETLRDLAADGRDAYYAGPIGVELALAVQAAGGVLSVEDLVAHRGQWVDPISTAYHDVEVATMPPNSQGITALIALNVLTALEADPAWPKLSAGGVPPGAGRVHAQLEALKVAWSERDRCVGEPERALCDLEELLSAGHARRLAERLDPDRAGRFVPATPTRGGTVYLCTADADGRMVSLINSNWMGFGSGVMGGGTGIMLHNRGNYFSLDAGHPNRLAPRSRPLHTLTPMMLLRDRRAWIAMGSMGGDGQPQYMVQLVNALVDDGLDPQAAVERPRWVADVEAPGQPLNGIRLEADGADPELVGELRRRGHSVELIEPRTAAVGWTQVIRRDPDGSYSGGADPRADSLALGL
jgi:gamma-glutamyltranspeptidase / glutathione hydrolase